MGVYFLLKNSNQMPEFGSSFSGILEFFSVIFIIASMIFGLECISFLFVFLTELANLAIAN